MIEEKLCHGRVVGEKRADLVTLAAGADHSVTFEILVFDEARGKGVRHADPLLQKITPGAAKVCRVVSEDFFKGNFAERNYLWLTGCGLANAFQPEVAVRKGEAALGIPVLHIKDAVHPEMGVRA